IVNSLCNYTEIISDLSTFFFYPIISINHQKELNFTYRLIHYIVNNMLSTSPVFKTLSKILFTHFIDNLTTLSRRVDNICLHLRGFVDKCRRIIALLYSFCYYYYVSHVNNFPHMLIYPQFVDRMWTFLHRVFKLLSTGVWRMLINRANN